MMNRVQNYLPCTIAVALCLSMHMVTLISNNDSSHHRYQPSDTELLETFQKSIVEMVGGSISEAEIAADFEIVRAALIPLLHFSQRNVALYNTLINCVKTLLTASKTQLNPTLIRDKQNEALVMCQEEFVFFCTTTEQYETISAALNRLGLYYAPLNSAFTQAHNHLQTDKSDRNFKIATIVIGCAAVVTLIYTLKG